ncbi:putative nuclease of restriction endonuclease-like (RecB) superfamily [Paraburkholderia atlantica]
MRCDGRAQAARRARASQRAVVSANRELVTLYWQIGRDILERQEQQGWGSGVVDRLARDFKAAFPDMRGFSSRNLKYMRALAQAFPQPEFVQQPVAQLPWSHVVTLLDKLDDGAQRLWYAEKSLGRGWSRSVLTMQIETAAHARAGSAVTDFADRLGLQRIPTLENAFTLEQTFETRTGPLPPQESLDLLVTRTQLLVRQSARRDVLRDQTRSYAVSPHNDCQRAPRRTRHWNGKSARSCPYRARYTRYAPLDNPAFMNRCSSSTARDLRCSAPNTWRPASTAIPRKVFHPVPTILSSIRCFTFSVHAV